MVMKLMRVMNGDVAARDVDSEIGVAHDNDLTVVMVTMTPSTMMMDNNLYQLIQMLAIAH